MIFSDSDSDHLASLAETLRALYAIRNSLVHGTSRVRENPLPMRAMRLQAREPALAAECAWANLLLFCARCDEADKPRTAATGALQRRLDIEDYGRPCPANLGRYLAAAGRCDARLPAREPVVANMMLPPSEVPECGPDTTVIEALERLVQSGTQALPVCEMSRVVGIVTLADLARNISGRQGGLPAETVKALMRPATIVPPDTPLPTIAQALADNGIIVVSGPAARPAGYLTAESVLTQAPPGTGARPAARDHPPLLMPGTGAVLLDCDFGR
jgi:CBS domain-containing protein